MKMEGLQLILLIVVILVGVYFVVRYTAMKTIQTQLQSQPLQAVRPPAPVVVQTYYRSPVRPAFDRFQYRPRQWSSISRRLTAS